MSKVLKRSLSLFLAIAIIFSSAAVGLTELDLGNLFAVKASAASEDDLFFSWNMSSESYTLVLCSSDAEGALVIPTYHNGYEVTDIGIGAFKNCVNLTSITLPSKLKYIWADAFSGCVGLTSITIPDSVIRINDSAFYDCENLKTVTIGTGLVTIGKDIFDGCKNLEKIYWNATSPSDLNADSNVFKGAGVGGIGFEVIFGDPVKSIPSYLFYVDSLLYTPNLTKVTVDDIDSVINIGERAFYNCVNLTSVIIGKIETIGEAAFQNCTSLNSFTIAHVLIIGASAFQGCTSLTSIQILGNLSGIGDSAFLNCTNLESIELSDTVTYIGADAFYNTEYYNTISNWINGVLYIDNNLVDVKTTVRGNYVVREGTTVIAGEAFYGVTGLTSITISDSVTNICKDAFEYCSGLTDVYTPGVESWCKISFGSALSNPLCYAYNLRLLNGEIISDVVLSTGWINAYTFYSCESLESVELCGDANLVGEYSFAGCTNLSSLIMADTTSYIGNYAFYECTSITSLTIPDGVTSLGNHAFAGCTGLISVEFGEGLTASGNGYVFKDCTNLVSVSFARTIKRISKSTFENCYSLSDISWPNDLQFIDASAFAYCYDLAITETPESLYGIGEDAFYGCLGIVSLTITSEVRSIGKGAFSGCTNLTAINVDENNKYYTSSDGVLFNSVRRILVQYPAGKNASEYEILAGVLTINDEAFGGCENLTSVVLPVGLENIGESAFAGCENLTTINIPDTVKVIGDRAFIGCNGISSITIGSQITSIGVYALGYVCDGNAIEDFIIYGVNDTVAEQYAIDNNFVFVGFNSDGSHDHASKCWVIDIPATCTTEGLRHKECVFCGESFDGNIIPLAGHSLDSTYKCIVCNKQFTQPLRDYTIYICDIETGNPISGAKVTLGTVVSTTDSTGAAKFQLENNNETTLGIVAETYPDYPASSYMPVGQDVDYIFLTSDESDIYSAVCNGENVINGSSQINIMAYSAKADITVVGRAKANILKYELIQGSVVIATSASGRFIIRNSSFKVGEDVYVRMYTDGTEGHNIFERRLNIDVFEYTVNFETDIKDMLPLQDGFSVELPEDTPGFSGREINFDNPFLENSDITYRFENDKIIVMVGFEKSFGGGSGMENLTAKEILKKLADSWVKERNVSAGAEARASMALVIEFDENGITDVYGQINLGFTLKLNGGQTFLLGFVPVRAEATLSLSGEVNITKLKYDVYECELYTEYDFLINGSITARAGVGVKHASAGVYGKIGLKIEFDSDYKNLFEKLTLYGEMGLYAKVTFFDFYEERVLWDGSKSWNGQLAATSPLLYSIDSYDIDQREYLQNRTPWLNTVLLSGDSTDVILQDSAYTAIEPKIVTCGDTIMMIFMDDDGSEGYNYQHLYYSIYDKTSGGWSEPQRVDNNNYPDMDFDVYADDSTIYVAYTEMDTIEDVDENDLGGVFSTLEVAVVKYSFDEGSFTNYTRLTDNDTIDCLPTISNTTDGIVVSWVNNISDDIFLQNANNMVYFSQLDGYVWSVPTAITDRCATIASIDLGTIGGKCYVAIVKDTDCDLCTVDDRIVYLIDLEGNITEIITEIDVNDGVQFVKMNGEDKLIWYNNQNIYHIDSIDDAPAYMFESSVQGLSGDFKFIQIDTNSCAVIFTKNETREDSEGNDVDGSGLYGVFCNNGVWGNVVPITQNEVGYYVDAYDVCMYDGKLLIPYINALVDITSTDIIKTTTFMSKTFNPECDLIVGVADIVPSGLFEGDVVEIYVPITNNAWQSLGRVSYEVRDSVGNIVYSGVLEKYIESGSTEYLEINLPKNLLEKGESYSIYVSTTDWSDTNTSNNVTDIVLWYTDFSVSASQILLGNKHQVQYTVANDGNLNGNAMLKIYKILDDGSYLLMTEKEISSLGVGETFDGCLDITQDYFSDDSETGKIVLSVVYEGDEVYRFNDSVTLTVGGLKQSVTSGVTGTTSVTEGPVADESYVSCDKASGTNANFTITENGWTFGGVDGLSADSYTYTDGVLTINSEYLMTLTEGRHAITLVFSKSALTTEVLCIVEVCDTSYDNTTVTANNTEVRFDGHSLVLGRDILYSTQSAGAVSTEYSTDNGATWRDGLPTGVGQYLVRINVAQDDVNKYLPTSCVIEVTITRGTRAISVPAVLGMADMQILFGNAIPTLGRNDGSILYGYSLVNDVNTVTEWSSNGILIIESEDTTYYVFAKIVGGKDYEDAYSVGFAVRANNHYYSNLWTMDLAPTCTESGFKSHYCLLCGYKDVVEIAPVGHDYELSYIESGHPHIAHNVCTRCSDTALEETFSLNCTACVFTHEDIDASTCRITGYIGISTDLVMPADILGKTVVNTSGGAFKNITDITSVKIEPGVQGIGSVAFMGCTSLSKVVIPESVTSIGARAFYNCADDFTIYCYRDTYAMQYAIDNAHSYYVMDVGEVNGTYIDYDNEVILTTREAMSNIEDMIYIPMTSMAIAEASMINGNSEFLGTGSIVLVFDGDDFSSEYTIIVDGDINGDSVCDALDAAQLALVSGGHTSLDGVYKTAADGNSDGVVDIADYQAVVNKAVA